MEFKIGQILNSKSNSLYGRLIRWRNGLIYGRDHNWSHSAIITEIKEDKVLVHEALTNGFVSNFYEKFWLENKIKKVFIQLEKQKLN